MICMQCNTWWPVYALNDLFFFCKLALTPEPHAEECCTTHFDDEECYPIPVRLSDTFYGQLNPPVTCLEFPRTFDFCSENNGVRQQFNENTHFIDASNVYGNTNER